MKPSLLKFAAPFAGLLLSTQAVSATVDLSTWTAEGAGNWVVQAGNDSVLQTQNGQPTYFFEAGSNAQGTSLSGEIRVQTTSDDDFIGFVLGYQSGENNSASTDFWLIDWKQNNQGAASRGLALSHVTDTTGAANVDFWSHANGVSEVQRASNLGNTGWADNTSYSFDLIFTNSLIEVFVDGVKELSYTAADFGSAFSDGAFGFFNYSQSQVLYSAITEDVVPVDAPASIALVMLGAAGLLASRRRISAVRT